MEGEGRGCYDEAKEPEWVARRNWPKTCALPDFALAFVLLCILSDAALLCVVTGNCHASCHRQNIFIKHMTQTV